MNRRSFAEFQEVVSLVNPIRSGRGSLYQCKTRPEHSSRFNWGMSFVFCFDGSASIEKWLSLRSRVGSLIAGTNLRHLVTLITYCEIGTDFIVSCKPPYEGGYSASTLQEWIEYREGGAPPEGCESSYATLVAEASALANSLSQDPEGASLLRESLSAENSDLFVVDGHWLLFELADDPHRP